MELIKWAALEARHYSTLQSNQHYLGRRHLNKSSCSGTVRQNAYPPCSWLRLESRQHPDPSFSKRWKQQFADGGAVVIAVDTNVLIRILVDEHCAALQMQSACALLVKSEVLFASERSGGNGIGKSR